MKTRGLLVLVTVMSLLLLTPEVFGGPREHLRGLKGVYVDIEGLKEDMEKDGLTKLQVKTDVELRLRKAGIKVLTKEELPLPKEYAVLFVNINSAKMSDSYAFNCSLEVMQAAKLLRDPEITGPFITWTKLDTGYTPKDNLRLIREALADQVDQFINDYLTVNPK